MKVKAPFRVEVHKPKYAECGARRMTDRIACFCCLRGGVYYHDELLFTVKPGTAFMKKYR